MGWVLKSKAVEILHFSFVWYPSLRGVQGLFCLPKTGCAWAYGFSCGLCMVLSCLLGWWLPILPAVIHSSCSQTPLWDAWIKGRKPTRNNLEIHKFFWQFLLIDSHIIIFIAAAILVNSLIFNLISMEEFYDQPFELIFLRGVMCVTFQTRNATIIVFTLFVQQQQS